MAQIKYIDKTFKPETLEVIRRANQICAEYARQGLTLTLRQLYYQFVARGLLENKQSEYSRLGSILNDARMAGRMDWDYLVDRTRNLVSLPHWDSPIDIIQAVAHSYRTDRWAEQPVRIECWIEKDAGIGVIESVCQRNDVPYFSCRGYTSVSEVWGAAQRLRRYLDGGQDVVILHIGDHDPSGIDMSRDIEERLRHFIDTDWSRAITEHVVDRLTREVGRDEVSTTWNEMASEARSAYIDHAEAVLWGTYRGKLKVRRIALNYDQVQQYDPPPNPAKSTDARYRKYVNETGLVESWELDALDPVVLQDLIQAEIDRARDARQWRDATERMEDERALLTQVAARWNEITADLDATD